MIHAEDLLGVAAVFTGLCWWCAQTYDWWEIQIGSVIQVYEEEERRLLPRATQKEKWEMACDPKDLLLRG